MGNTQHSSIDIKKVISGYNPGDVDDFQKIVKKVPDSFHKDPNFKAWKLSCIKTFMRVLDEDQHDIAVNESKIIEKFQELEADAFNGAESTDPIRQKSSKELLDVMYIATGDPLYSFKPNRIVKFAKNTLEHV